MGQSVTRDEILQGQDQLNTPGQDQGQNDHKWYMTLHHLQMHSLIKFEIISQSI